MTLDLPTTLAVFLAGLALFGFAAWRARQPPNPLKTRMINYHVVQIFTIILLLLMMTHLVTLITGHALPGRLGTTP
jgi:hypothetical protein